MNHPGEIVRRPVTDSDRSARPLPQSTPVTAKDYEELVPTRHRHVLNAAASLAVRSLQAASVWYSRLFGWPADADSLPDFAQWKFDRGGCLQIYQLQERAGMGSVTLSVADLQAQIAHLRQLGIEPGVMMQSAGAKVIMIKDPDGNSLAFAETTDSAIGR